MILPWVFHAPPHGPPTSLPLISHSLVSHGSLMSLPRVSLGPPMVSPYVYIIVAYRFSHGWSPAISMGPHCPRCFPGASRWDFHGTPMGFPRRFHGSGPHVELERDFRNMIGSTSTADARAHAATPHYHHARVPQHVRQHHSSYIPVLL